MKSKPRAGLLPLYLKTYDDYLPENRPCYEPFMAKVASGLEKAGLEVLRADVCRLASESREAIQLFEQGNVDCIVTLHLAYAASLESADVLAGSDLPLLLLDTTMDYEFGFETAPDRAIFDQGIHGVQDLANVLRRKKRSFQIVAGHVDESDVLARAAGIVRAAKSAREFLGSRALLIGELSPGMGDVNVPDEILKESFGIQIDRIDVNDLACGINDIGHDAIRKEMDLDRRRFECDLSEPIHQAAVSAGLGLRRYLEENAYDAFSMYFLSFITAAPPITTLPFLEASKAMERGTGYAGEGDTLTALFLGALSSTFERTTFTEPFCPDWKNNALFISHMGEVNPAIAAQKPLLCEKPFPMPNIVPPAILACAPAPGPATLINFAPAPGDAFQIIAAPVEVLGDTINEEMRRTIRGWIRPQMDLACFLETYSRAGGSHHCALALGDIVEPMQAMAAFLNIPFCEI